MRLGIKNFTNHPTLGAITGIGAALFARWSQNVPLHFKLPSRLVAPSFPWINAGMQTLVKGGGKYAIVLAPLLYRSSCAAKKSYQERSIQPLKDFLFSYETLFTISALAFTLLAALTEHVWTSALTSSVGLNLGQPSGHVMVVLGFSAIFSAGIQALKKEAAQNQTIALKAIALFSSIASCVFLFNTVRYYHTVIETISALFVESVALICSYQIAIRLNK